MQSDCFGKANFEVDGGSRGDKLQHYLLEVILLAEFIAELHAAAALSAKNGCILRAPQVDSDLALTGAMDLLIAAVANLLQMHSNLRSPERKC